MLNVYSFNCSCVFFLPQFAVCLLYYVKPIYRLHNQNVHIFLELHVNNSWVESSCLKINYSQSILNRLRTIGCYFVSLEYEFVLLLTKKPSSRKYWWGFKLFSNSYKLKISKIRNFSDIVFYDSLTFTTGTSPACPDPTHKPNATECGTADESLVCYNGVRIAFLFCL